MNNIENKYYTPQLEEFHIGFEYEHNYMSVTGTAVMDFSNDNPTKIINLENPIKNWASCIYNPLDIWSRHNIQDIQEAIKEDRIRVKTLDQEDIESLGWKHIEKYKNYTISSNSEWLLQQYTEGWGIYSYNECCFRGDIKNKSELKKLMLQIGIKTNSHE